MHGNNCIYIGSLSALPLLSRVGLGVGARGGASSRGVTGLLMLLNFSAHRCLPDTKKGAGCF